MSTLSSDLASLSITRQTIPSRASKGKAWVYLGACCALGATAWLAGPRLLEARLFKTEVRLSDISVVSPAQSSVLVTSTGYVVPQLRSSVSAKMMGRIVRVQVKEGEAVRSGQTIAELDGAEQRGSIRVAQLRAAAARARVAAASASLAEMTRQVERNATLVEAGALAKATLEDARLRCTSLERQLHVAEVEARAAESELGPMQVSLEDRLVLAPIDGVITTKPLAVGELVGPLVTIAEITDFASMLVEIDVPEGRLYQIKPSMPCEIVLDAYPAKRYRGEVVELGKRVDRAKATVTVKVRFVDPMEGVLPQMSARASFLSAALSDAAVRQAPKRIVPADAVVERGGRKSVFVVDDDVVKLVPVTVGPQFGAGLELIDGPRPGTRVVSEPPASLSNGQRIKEKGT